ncbi:HFL143Cp [Eremothecium sinecaudum]|uniref:UDP-N-acetylglucosamine diphosphorylase n=1 Tax=Eremothecium sinecaudum TaxID=45286 RepID=A0A0X8HUM9_9SACH|nr:HFL143Cp [Eremothecium sinecaudum]AMD21713.1 HFL143Cp [Eremothecium sinecaudum]
MDTKSAYEAAGQGHLFMQWRLLTDVERKELLSNLAGKDPVKLLKQCQEALKLAAGNTSHSGEVEPLPQSSYESVVDNPREVNERYEKLGMDALKGGKVAVILMAGGQGTRLGSSLPKGCYDVGLPSHKSLFQIQAERLMTLERISGCQNHIPWYIMTSPATRAATEDFFRDYKYFGLDPTQVKFFNQGTFPALDLTGKKLMLKSKTELVESPDGNGGLYRALRDNKILEELTERGIEHIHMYSVDNVLVKLADPVFLGYAISHKFDLATKVVRKRDANEAVGLIVSKGGKPSVIEYSEISKEATEATEENTGLLKLRAANIVNHYYSVSMLKDKLDHWCNELPYHVARKKIQYYDPERDTIVKPDTINGIKLEQFIFDVFHTIPMEKFGCLEVDRSLEFSPLKSGPGSPNDNPETSRLAYLKLGTKWLKDAGAKVKENILVEVSCTLSYSGESLGRYKDKTFASDGEYIA